MAAASLIAACHRLGVGLSVDGGSLIVRPKSAVPPALRAELIAGKPGLLALLGAAPNLGRAPHGRLDPSAPGNGDCYACGSVVFWILHGADELVCAICHPPGPPPDQIEWRRGRTRG